MLESEEAELAEGLSRLCVLRTEDYQLLKSIRKVQREKPDKAYLAIVLTEFRKREQWRSDREVELLSQLGAWEYSFYSEKRFIEGMSWREMGAFKPVYVEGIQATYHLEPKDLVDTPFATLETSKFLYACDKKSPLYALGYKEVLEMFFIHAKDDSPPSAVHAGVLVDTLYPLQRNLECVELDGLEEGLPENAEVTAVKDDIINFNVKPTTRATLRASRKVWQVLFLLWKQLLIRCPIDGLKNVNDVFHTLTNTAGNFLNTQRCRFVSLLESTDTMHQ